MPSATSLPPYICAYCLRARNPSRRLLSDQSTFSRTLSTSLSPLAQEQPSRNDDAKRDVRIKEEEGAMSRRLSELTNQAIEGDLRGAGKVTEEAGFSEDLKRQLEDRIAEGRFRSENAGALSQVELSTSAGKGTRDIAAAQPWTGSETTEDAVLRMLTDAHKPLRGGGSAKPPTLRSAPLNMKPQRQKTKGGAGQRLANARDRTSTYSLMKDSTMTPKEREEMQKVLKERFTAGARPMPTSMQGLASLANERIEDAISRGQFKNLPRGKQIERDYTASSPFLDTTEYFMNKIIQKQEIVPPWIEKQQELVKAAAVFRGRLRADWKRHASRVISSKGGPLRAQISRAKAYAAAEMLANPKQQKVEALSAVDDKGDLSQLTLVETPQTLNNESDVADLDEVSKITLTETRLVDGTPSETPLAERTEVSDPSPPSHNPHQLPQSTPEALSPFRDPVWQATEHAYQTLAISDLNNLTRSYNLMAPNLAKKPYFSLERELRTCFADVAPKLADSIKERARAPKLKVEVVGHRPGGVLERFGGEKARVWDERKPQYGFKEFWKDLWG
ncbi:MAG: hypothetical protein M1812_004881 [Candelaria pacifica]|nr:MAG: hypothetical protein M1812_004881 [Candelaria pacifica]